MITKAKALYQVKLILDYLPDEEYKLIPQETIDYIEDNFEYDENFSIDPSIPLEKQKIDDKAYEFLDKIVKSVESNKKENTINQNSEIEMYVKQVKESNKNYNANADDPKDWFKDSELAEILDAIEMELIKIYPLFK